MDEYYTAVLQLQVKYKLDFSILILISAVKRTGVWDCNLFEKLQK